MVDFNSMLNIAVIVLGSFIAIILMSNFVSVMSCSTISNTTLKNACNATINNGATLFSLAAVLILLLIVPLIRGVLSRGVG